MSTKPTEEELQAMGLSPDEIAGMLEDHGDESDADDNTGGAGADAGAGAAAGGAGGQEGGDAGNGAAGAGADEAAGAAGGAGAADAGAAGAGGADDPAAAAAATAQAAAAQQAAPNLPAAPVQPTPDPRIEEIAASLKELDQKFDDGELTSAEYREQQRALNDESEALRWNARKVEIQNDMIHTQRQQSWGASVMGFLERADNAQLFKQGSLPFQALDTAVIAIQAERLAAGQSDIDPSILEEARKRVLSEFGIATSAPSPEADADAAAAAAAAATGKPQPQTRKPAAPMTLANVPAAAGTETSDQTWAALDRLRDNPSQEDPEAYERAVAALSPEARARYLAA